MVQCDFFGHLKSTSKTPKGQREECVIEPASSERGVTDGGCGGTRGVSWTRSEENGSEKAVSGAMNFQK